MASKYDTGAQWVARGALAAAMTPAELDEARTFAQNRALAAHANGDLDTAQEWRELDTRLAQAIQIKRRGS